ncbi:hypothetical protein ABF87_10400 [Nitrosomonas sp. JL21]|uniref:hypothetical protein n=1 Tax=Nitrosomonas sp. JL21 TaxID=153949 RepID=UPI00136EA7F9|nr:hypothetical protein [Nitrosomonas sp. JL21]MBL8497695.1 hypothetical protein [Nitrosomonas sp.]MCC7091209.1 hypothetical protein [Nitrosomonas sp.]MXS78362.1 hypothetical protein [Nitrosomonas sp. JL21]
MDEFAIIQFLRQFQSKQKLFKLNRTHDAAKSSNNFSETLQTIKKDGNIFMQMVNLFDTTQLIVTLAL